MLPDLALYMKALESLPENKFHRRARWHDYFSRCIYMVTLMKIPGIPDFSFIKESNEKGKIQASAQSLRLGHHVGRALRNLPRRFEEVRVLQYVFMPDHVHLLLEITKPSAFHLNDIIRYFAQDCSTRYRRILKEDYDFDFTGNVFFDGYNDRIVYKKDQLNILFEYIRDNPRRLYLRQSFPQYFRNNILMTTQDRQFSLFGNILLLEHPDKEQVRFSSKYTQEEISARCTLWEEVIRNGGVLVSPFYHPQERDFLNKAIAEGGKVIIICENGFPPRWKPEKRYLDICTEGRMLFVGPAEFDSRKITLTRSACLQRNDDAAYIASMRRGAFSIRRAKSQ